jgi:hypothetical protein
MHTPGTLLTQLQDKGMKSVSSTLFQRKMSSKSAECVDLKTSWSMALSIEPYVEVGAWERRQNS